MQTYSVSDVAKMLNVNDETIRRWIRDGKLSANRALGRGGSSILLNDVITFANQPPRAYLLALEAWLSAHNITFQKVEDQKPSKLNGKSIALAGTGIVGALTGPIGLGVAGAVYGATKLASRKNYHPYTIQLDVPDTDAANIQPTVSTQGDTAESYVQADCPESDARPKSTPEPASPEVTGNILNEIARAKSLLDAEIITQEEFVSIKTKLISRL